MLKTDIFLLKRIQIFILKKRLIITVLIELPHSKETWWGAKGLAGHSAMAIGERYFDYEPNNTPIIYNEKDYDSDFNNDGDKDNDVQLNEPSFMNSPGQPWWGTHIVQKKGITGIILNYMIRCQMKIGEKIRK